MPASKTSALREDLFPVMLGGQSVVCRCLEDAIAVKAAEDILSGNDPTPYRPEQLERMADVLLNYGHRRAAIELTHWGDKL